MSPIEAGEAAGVPMRWEAAFYELTHPLQIATIEALAWIDAPLSAKLMVDVFDRRFRLNTLAYHLRRFADAGVIEEVETIPRRGASEHLYRLIKGRANGRRR